MRVRHAFDARRQCKRAAKPRRRKPYARSETRRPERGRNTVAVLADRKIRTKTAQMGRIWL
jgi:hypothetical protein